MYKNQQVFQQLEVLKMNANEQIMQTYYIFFY